LNKINRTVQIFLAAFWAAGLILALFAPTAADRSVPEGSSPVMDMTGAPVYLSAPPERVMFFAPVVWHYLTLTENDNSVLSVAAFMVREIREGLLGRIFPGLLNIPEALTSMGAIPLSVEQALVSRPDLVLSWATASQDYVVVKYPGLVQLLSVGDIELLLYGLLSEVSRKQDRKKWLFERFKDQMAMVERNAAFSREPVKIMMINNDDLFVWNSNYKVFNQILKRLNMVNVAENLKPYNGPGNIENLLTFDPDFILLNYSCRLSVADVYAEPRLRALKAVSGRRVFRMPSGLARMDGPVERPLFYLWICRLVYPGSGFGPDFRQVLFDTYRTVYGYELSSDEIAAMLHITENSLSHGYAVFK
jgi:iron complex transport system substrate-binding protein